MTAADIAAAARMVAQNSDWGDLSVPFTFYVRHPGCHPILIEAGGKIAGLAVGTQRGAAGWLGHLFVAPGYRRRGMGRLLTETVLERLELMGCLSLVLIAPEAVEPLFQKLGFGVQSHYHSFQGPVLGTVRVPTSLRPLAPRDLTAICRLDRTITGEDRSPLYYALTESGWVLTGPDNGLLGFGIRTRWGTEPTAARDLDSARLLLDVRRAAAGMLGLRAVQAQVLTENLAGRELLELSGFREVGRQARMVRGEPLPWQPEGIWGIFSAALG